MFTKGTEELVLFFQIFFANIALVFLLISVHEFGHWLMGRIVGIPSDQMRIRLFIFPQQVQIRDSEGWVSIATFDRYFNLLREMVPTRRGQFAYVVGGFLLETCFLVLLTLALQYGGFRLYAIVVPGVSLTMYLVYLFVMDIPQSKSLHRPWGDSTILYSLNPRWSMFDAFSMDFIRSVLIIAASFGWP